MKIQYLTVIFILIMMPIIIVFSEYLNTQINVVNTEALYDERLLNSTYDAVKAFQINTINTTLFTPEARVANMEASVNIFFNSLITSFNYTGNRADIMKEYVPAVVLTMYDGYYIYSPFINTLTNIEEEDVDEDYKDGKVLSGLKPFVSYTCEYKVNDTIYMITYSMDNYIVVDIFNGSEHKRKEGYLIDGITKNGDIYTYDGIEFTENAKEKLKEYIGDGFYYYTVRNGTKYYYEDKDPTGKSDNDRIFYIDNSGERKSQVISYINNETKFDDYYREIFGNNTAYKYYKEAYEFTEWVRNSDLADLTIDEIDPDTSTYADYEFTDVGKIFDGNIQYSNSNFNRHRADVIRAVITTNLQSAITGFAKFSKSTEQFIMPKISETDWELLENNICMVTFMQGMKVGGKTYNSYSVVPNNFNKEYVSENDIYILKNDQTYAKVNDSTLNNSKIATGLGYQPGVLKINFEKRQSNIGEYFNPISINRETPYLQSYTSIAGTSKLESITTIDMYRYMKGKTEDDFKDVKRAYYTALARERYGSYKFTK